MIAETAAPGSAPRSEAPHRRVVAAAALIATFAPLLLLVANRDWMFTEEARLDPWHYVGFFREYWNPYYSPGAYKLARLPWILSGMLFTQVFSTATAAYALHLTYFCAMTLAMFVGVYWMFHRLSLAVVVALALGFFTHVHGSGGWDYHNTAAGTFYVATFMMLASQAALAGRPWALMIAGACAALTVHANITLVNFLPVLAFVHLRTIHVRLGSLPTLRLIRTRLFWMLAGGVLITALLGLVNLAAGREFLFFGVLFDIVVRYVSDPSNQAQWRPIPGWYFTAKHLAWPAAVFVVGTAWLVRFRGGRTPDERLSAALVLQFLVMALVWVAWHFAGQTALDWSYFAYALTPSCFIALAGLLRTAWPDACERHWLAVSVGTALVFTIGLGGGIEPFVHEISTPAVMAVMAPIVTVLLVAGLGAWFLRPAAWTLVVFVAVYGVGNRLAATEGASVYGAGDPCKTQREIYLAIVDAASWIGTIDPSYTLARTWFEENETMPISNRCQVGVGRMSGAITTMAGVPYLVSPFPMPDVDQIPASDIFAIANGEAMLTIITKSTANLEKWQKRLSDLGLSHRQVAHHRVPLIDSEFDLYAWTLDVPAPEGVVFAEPVTSVTDETRSEVNTYGSPRGEVRQEGAGRVFRPTDLRDHIAYAMVETIPSTVVSWGRLNIEGVDSNPRTCRVAVQDRNFRTLVTAACATTTKYFHLPPLTTGIRVMISDLAVQPFTLPRHVDVSTAVE